MTTDRRLMNDKKLAAGDFSAWATKMRRVLDDECSAEVPCGGCTACCTSSQFIHIEPDEIDTIAHVPAQLLFRAPERLPAISSSDTTREGTARC